MDIGTHVKEFQKHYGAYSAALPNGNAVSE